jgi:hypothetical protein
MKGIWLLPSRRRIEKLKVFFANAMRNNISTPGVVLVQQDELKELKSLYEGIKKPDNWKILPTFADGMGDKYREIWPAVKNLDWVGIGCDDLRPQTYGWDRMLLHHLNGSNVVSCNDGQQGNLRMAGITVFSGGLLRAIGYIYPPNFWHTYVDNVWEDIGRETGCWTYVNEVLVTHDHPFTNQQLDPLKTDDTTLKSYGKSQWDQQCYVNWCKTDKQQVIERVKRVQT